MDTKKKMCDAVKQDRFMTARELEKNPILNHKGVSYHTINRMLLEEGLHSFMASNKPYISEAAAIRRYNWARDVKVILRRNPYYFEDWIFSDESYLRAVKQGKVLVRKARGEVLQRKYTVEKKKFSGGLRV